MVNEIFAISEGEDDIEAAALQSRLKETIHQLFKFGFEVTFDLHIMSD